MTYYILNVLTVKKVLCQIIFNLIDVFIDESFKQLQPFIDCFAREVWSTMEKYKHFILAPSRETN